MKRMLLAGVSSLALATGAAWLACRSNPARPSRPESPHMRDGDEQSAAAAARDILAYFVVPVWIAAGIADWACHRASNIEHAAGPQESGTHLLMLAEMGMPSLAGLFLEINAPVFALMIGAFLAHEATALGDVSYAVKRREVTPIEQHVHSFLELMPLNSLCLLATLHWNQFTALFGCGDEPADWRLRWKEKPLPTPYLVTVLGAIALFNLAPYVEELWRGWRAAATERRCRRSRNR